MDKIQTMDNDGERSSLLLQGFIQTGAICFLGVPGKTGARTGFSN